MPLKVRPVDVLTDGAAVVEPHTGIDCQPIAYCHGIGREQRSRDELSAVYRRIAGDGLKELAIVVDESGARRNDLTLVVQPLFQLRANFPLVIGPEEAT